MKDFRNLPEGGTIGIVAPSGYIDQELAQRGIDNIRAAGYRVKVAPHVFGPRTSVFAASDELRAADLASMIRDDEVDAILCARGGYGAVRTLQTMGENVLDECRKWVVGFSDITVLHSALTKRGIPSLHGPMLKHIATHGMQSPDVAQLFSTMRGEASEVRMPAHPLNRQGMCRGVMKGGNLSIIYSLRGTPVDIDPRGAVFFIEDLAEYRYHTDRMMQSLAYSGFLSRLGGLVVGQFTDQKDGATPFGKDAYAIVAEAVRGYDYPVAFGFPAGHASEENWPIVMGSEAELTVTTEGAKVGWPACE